MKKLNNKGMTIVEILVTFVIIASITISIYASIASLKGREEIASYKESINTYKNLLTRDIENDIIMKKLTGITVENPSSSIILKFKNKEEKKLTVNKSDLTIPKNPQLCKNNTNSNISNQESITYGDETYPLPVLGSDNIITGSGCQKLNKLKIDTVTLTGPYPTNLYINIRLYHPDLGYKYNIRISAPINYE